MIRSKGISEQSIIIDHLAKPDIFPYIDKVFDLFGAERLMFGSDWPVCKLAEEYDVVCGLVDQYLSKLSIREQKLVWAKNAEQFYKL